MEKTKKLTQKIHRFSKDDIKRVEVLKKELRISTEVDVVRHAVKTLYDSVMRKKVREVARLA